LAYCAVSERLGEMALASAAGADDENRGALVEIAATGEIVDQCTVELGQEIELESIERLVGAKGSAPEARRNFFCSRWAISSSINRARNSVKASLDSMAWRLRASRESRMPDRRSCFRCGVSAGMGFMERISSSMDL
jgi:hypothetical protein